MGIIGTGFGVLLALRNASQLSHSPTSEQFEVFGFSLGVTGVIIAMCILTMWPGHRRRAT